MSNTIFRRCLLNALLLCALVFTAQTFAFGVQPQTAGGGKIVGRILERGTNLPLAGEVGVSFHVTGQLLLRHSKASEQGEFVIDGLEAGKIQLVTKVDGYAAEHQSVSLSEGEIKQVVFSLTKVKLLRGIVLGPARNPVFGASVKVIYATDPPARGEIRTTYQWEAGETYSDQGGNFIIGVHPERAFVVEASHPGFLGVASPPMRVRAVDKEAFVSLLLDGGLNVAGDVRDESGNVVQGAQVRLIEVGSKRAVPGFISHELLRQQTRYTVSGPNGTFRFEQVKRSKKMLVVVHPSYQPFRQLVELGSGAPTPVRVALTTKK